MKYDFQPNAIRRGTEFLRQAKPTESLMLKGPTGCGKSYIIAAVHKATQATVVVPSHEIAIGIYSKEFPDDPTFCSLRPAKQRALLEAAGIWTVKRLHAQLLAAAVPLPKLLIFDESHHSVDATHTTLYALTGFAPRLGLTATDYRGTPVETGKLREAWPVIEEIISLKAAVDTGVIARPDFITWPLLDDHEIDVTNGEFVVKQVDSAVRDRLLDLVGRIRRYYDGTLYDRPTMVTFSSVQQCRYALSAFTAAGLPAVVVVGDSDPDFESDRAGAFRRVIAREVLLLQVQVVGEGVDMPIRRLIDVAPTMSPMRWMQRVGRATRPTDEIPQVITCCHNFTRHSYLWHGVIPPSVILQKGSGAVGFQ